MKAEKLWNYWFTVNTIAKTIAISEEKTTPSYLAKSMKLPRAPVSVLRVESKQSERQSRMARKHDGNQPFKSLESRVREREQNIIAAKNNSKMSQYDKMNKTAQVAASDIIEKLNISYLPAIYQADKMLQKL